MEFLLILIGLLFVVFYLSRPISKKSWTNLKTMTIGQIWVF